MPSWRKIFGYGLALAVVASAGARGAEREPDKAEPDTIFTAPTTVIPADVLAELTPTGLFTTRKRHTPLVLPMDCAPAPKSTDPKSDPKLPFDPKAADQVPNAFAGATETGTQPGEMFDARMFGDQFGIYGATLRQQTVLQQLIFQQQQVVTTRTLTGTILTGVAGPTTNYENNPVAGVPIVLTFSAIAGGNTIFGQAIPGNPAFGSAGTFTAPLTATPLNENAAIAAIAATQALPGEQVVFVSGVANVTGAPTSGVFPNNIVQTYNYVLVNNVLVAVPVSSTRVQTLSAVLPLPSGGGVVGITKVIDGNSVIPRSRLILDFDYFANTPLAINGFDVYRFSPGFEWAFLDGRASVEVRTPFASTVDSSSDVKGISNRATAFGDVFMNLKGLFYSSEQVNLSTGVGLALPTGNDTQVSFADGTDFIRIKNRSVLITPYLAGLYTPSERLFIQSWATVAFDASGSPVYANPSLNHFYQAGRLHNQTLLQLSSQIGYWLKQDRTGQDTLTGLATFFELHYTTALDNAESVQAGNLSIASTNNRFDELNLSTGVNAIINQRLGMILGVAVPLRTGGNRFFDYQVGVRLNYFFGPNPTPRNYVAN